MSKQLLVPVCVLLQAALEESVMYKGELHTALQADSPQGTQSFRAACSCLFYMADSSDMPVKPANFVLAMVFNAWLVPVKHKPFDNDSVLGGSSYASS